MYSYVSTSLAFGSGEARSTCSTSAILKRYIRTCDSTGHEIAAFIVLMERRCGKRKHIDERNLNRVAPRARLIGRQY